MNPVFNLEVPPEGKAAVLSQFFTPDTANGLKEEVGSQKFWRGVGKAAHQPAPVAEIIETLAELELPATRECIMRLGDLALAHNPALLHVHSLVRAAKSMEAHRDDIPFASLTFLVVASGTAQYRLGGRSIGGRVLFGADHPAAAGDVVCLNNLARYKQRPLHQVKNATGKRLLLDFTSYRGTPGFILPAEY